MGTSSHLFINGDSQEYVFNTQWITHQFFWVILFKASLSLSEPQFSNAYKVDRIYQLYVI